MTREEEIERAEQELSYTLVEIERSKETLKRFEEETNEWYSEFNYLQEMESDVAWLKNVIEDLKDES